MNISKKEKQFYDKLWRHMRGGFSLVDSHYTSNKPNWAVVNFGKFVKKKIKTGKALDLGCGNGSNLIALEKMGFKTCGIDFSQEALKIAKRNAKENKIKLNLVKGSILDLPFEGNQFDLVIDSGCLHHLRKYQWPMYMKNLLKVLKPGGYYYLNCFNIRTDLSLKGFRGASLKRNWTLLNGHFNHLFKWEELDGLFGQDFKIIKEAETDRNGFPIWFWGLWMQRKNK